MELDIEWGPSGMCPVQAMGTINGLPFYFRARGSHWSFAVSTNPHEYDAVDMNCFPDKHPDGFLYSEEYGTFPDAGYIPDAEAIAFIEKAAQLFMERTV